jgi:hypothetical protein
MLKGFFTEIAKSEAEYNKMLKGVAGLPEATTAFFDQAVPFISLGRRVSVQPFHQEFNPYSVREMRIIIHENTRPDVRIHVIESHLGDVYPRYDAGVTPVDKSTADKPLFGTLPDGEDFRRWVEFQRKFYGLVQFEPDGFIPDFTPKIQRLLAIS